MAPTKKADSSTGKKSTKTRTLASEKEKAVKPSAPVQTKNESASGLKEQAELLSLIQEDVRRYSATLAVGDRPLAISGNLAKEYIFIALPAPDSHAIDIREGHILLDSKPVTGWKE